MTFLVALVPLGWLIERAWANRLGANPIEHIIHLTGDWTLSGLLIVLSMTPLRRLTGWQELVRLRRMLGLFAFFYSILHLLAYSALDLHFDWQAITHDLGKHPYVWAGAAGNLLLWPLALTSNRRAMHWLGARWKTLHQLVYFIPGLGVLHYSWLVKRDLSWPLTYGALWLILLLVRLPLFSARLRRFTLIRPSLS